jgi:hypothetical protein
MFWHEKNLLGIFGEKGESMQTAVLVLLIWTMLWSMIVCEGEDAIVARLKEESDHKNTFMAKMSHELRSVTLVLRIGLSVTSLSWLNSYCL